MPPFPKPRFAYDIDLARELVALRDYERDKPGRDVPDKRGDNLLLATWNIANLGAQHRTPEAYRLLAEIVSWFDLVALQEVNATWRGYPPYTRSCRVRTAWCSPTPPATTSVSRSSTTR